MCGIAGVAAVAGLARTDVALVDAMLRTLAHRGPDDHHAINDRHVAMGARRLAIIDLDTGRQPLSNEDGTIWVTQNGEIYDYLELRADLAGRGHVLKTKGDTEAIVHAYEEYGERFPEKSAWHVRRGAVGRRSSAARPGARSPGQEAPVLASGRRSAVVRVRVEGIAG